MTARLITLLFLFPLFTFAQSNFKKAYYVSNENDTIRGVINYKDLPGNPRSFSFKHSEADNESNTLSISQVRYFSIEGYQDFARHFISISMNEITLEGVRGSEEPDKMDTVFLKVLLKGNHLDMFAYTDKLKTRYYVHERGQASPIELLYRQDREKTVPIFQQQLSTLAIKYNKLSDELNSNIQNAYYTRPTISKIVSRINDKAEVNFSEIKDKKQKLRLFLGAGLNLTHITYKGQNVVTYENSPSGGRYRDRVRNSLYAPSIVIGVDFFTNPDIQRLLVRNEISAFKFTSENGSVQQLYYPEEQVSFEYRLAAISVGYSPQLIYNVYNAKNLKWNFGGGPSFFFWNYPVNEMHQKPLSQSSIYSDTVNYNYVQLKKSTVGVIVRSGLVLSNRLDVGVKALVNPSFISNNERKTTIMVSFVNLGVNYLFSRKR